MLSKEELDNIIDSNNLLGGDEPIITDTTPGTPATELRGSALLESLSVPQIEPTIEKGQINERGAIASGVVGAEKGIVSTLTGASSLGERLITGLGRLVTPKKFEKKLGFERQEKTSAEELVPEKLRTPEGTAEKVGFTIEQIAEFLVPVTKVAKGEKALSLTKRIVKGATEFGGKTAIQEGEIDKDTAIAASIGGAFPVAGRVLSPVVKIVGRLFKGLGAGLSGASSNVLETIVDNPKLSQKISENIIKNGQESLLVKNAKTILEGISTIRQQARAAYGKGVEALSKLDIKSSIIKKNITELLNKNGIKIKNKKFDFTNSEIFDKKIVDKAKVLLSDLNSKANPSGKDLRIYLDKLESSKFKSALEPSRQAFNNLLKDVSSGVKKSVSESTNKLDSINAKFSQELSLTESMESIFGKVKFKNTKELNNVARKLEGLFNKKGLDPKTIDNFLTRVGVAPEEFKTAEAVRSIATKTTGTNTKGLSFAEILQQITSSIITPDMVKNIAVTTGLSKNIINSIVKNASPAVRAAIIKGIINSNE